MCGFLRNERTNDQSSSREYITEKVDVVIKADVYGISYRHRQGVDGGPVIRAWDVGLSGPQGSGGGDLPPSNQQYLILQLQIKRNTNLKLHLSPILVIKVATAVTFSCLIERW